RDPVGNIGSCANPECAFVAVPEAVSCKPVVEVKDRDQRCLNVRCRQLALDEFNLAVISNEGHAIVTFYNQGVVIFEFEVIPVYTKSPFDKEIFSDSASLYRSDTDVP